MPEGHTIHRLARDHRKHFAGQTILVSSPQGRFVDGAATLDGQQLLDVSAHGKHLFYHWKDETILHVHLGLYGKFRLHKKPVPDPRGQVRVRMIGDERGVDLNGPNQCEVFTLDEHDEIRSRLGEDPLRSDADPEQAWQRISRSRAGMGSLLLNQSVIAGVGNIYRCEALFALGIHPDQEGRSLDRDDFDELWTLLVAWLNLGVRNNRIITVDPNRFGKPPSKLKRDERLMIYKKARCPNCDRPVEKWDCAARAIYACLTCQPLK